MKKGYTLIETMVCLSIFCIISVVVMGVIKIGLELWHLKKIDNYATETLSFIYLCENSCREENTTGYMEIHNDYIEFKLKGKVRNRLIIDKSVRISWTNGGQITIDNLGHVSTAGTLKIENNKVKKEIKVWVGTGGVYLEK